MIRRIGTIAVFVLIGAVVNVGVAWGLVLDAESNRAAFSKVDWEKFEHASVDNLRWLDAHGLIPRDRYADVDIADLPVEVGRHSFHAGVNIKAYSWIEPVIGVPAHASFAKVVEGGWPYRAFRGELIHGVGMWRFEPPGNGQIVLGVPLSPEWFGMAVNTAAYAVAAWVVWMMPGVVWRRVRKMRGRCAGCGHELRKSGVEHERCPECGRGCA
ncbi:MAG TPA: hypothetical protein VG711_02365 [Phycisphaerales bacterium]|nr:hypothetical protein [Phycisphaerales bacterium]